MIPQLTTERYKLVSNVLAVSAVVAVTVSFILSFILLAAAAYYGILAMRLEEGFDGMPKLRPSRDK